MSMDDSVAAQKKKLRQAFLTVRKSLSAGELAFLSQKITGRLLENSVYLRADTIHSYVSINDNSEIISLNFIRASLDRGKRVVVPKMGTNGRMTHHQIHSLDELAPNEWGVPEPAADRPVDLGDISLVIVPMVGADFDKNRLGYGMGYYDRFLKETEAVRIGLCLNCTLSWSTLPTNKFDQPMDQIITESAILQ
jgi:5-formyltetrahydrofolate cyclo-ligase